MPLQACREVRPPAPGTPPYGPSATRPCLTAGTAAARAALGCWRACNACTSPRRRQGLTRTSQALPQYQYRRAVRRPPACFTTKPLAFRLRRRGARGI